MANCIQCGRKLPGLTLGKKVCQWCVQHEAAQRGEIAEDARQPVMDAPWARRRESGITLTQVLFGACVAVYLAMALYSGALDFSNEAVLRFGAIYGPYTLSGQWWRVVTYMFLHGGLMHIAFNMWCLWDLGALSESLYGRWTYAAIYLITGVAGGIASIGWNPGVLTVGASGAIFGLAGALLASFYLGEFSFPSVAIRGTMRSLVFFIGFNIMLGAGLNIFGGDAGRIDNACHIGGLVSGMALGALIAVVAPQRGAPLRRVGVVAIVALAVAGSAYGVERWRGGPFRLERAFSQISRNDPQRAMAQLEALVRAQPNSAPAHLALGQEYFRQEKFPGAEAEFKRTIDLSPRNAWARLELGMVYLNENRPSDAKDEFAKVLAQDPGNTDAHYGMGMVLAADGQHQAAIDQFKSAATDSEISGVNYEMGRSYAALKMYGDAIDSYLQEKTRSGDDPDLELALAEAYQADGKSQEAQDARSKAAQLKSSTHK